ncbi:hypothetical protein RPALISO_221 [Ruegeria phage RpAliso]|nr:hypothetical protein RPALISO_221 [Ruegeria phage RpAliso]
MSDVKRTLNPNPLQYAGGYSLDLYCKFDVVKDDDGGYFHHRDASGAHFYGETRGEAMRAARAAGWTIHRDRTATCPSCAKALGLR